MISTGCRSLVEVWWLHVKSLEKWIFKGLCSSKICLNMEGECNKEEETQESIWHGE
jgi:hypothetical protein